MHRLAATVLIATLAGPALAATPAEIQAGFAAQARRDDPAFAAFSAERGRQFFAATHGKEWSCTSCHTANPAAAGKHTVTGKPIAPLAPAANPERFATPAKVDKWFTRNCNDVAGRPCTAREKGDVLAWLLTLK
jgi:mono/diheme cytochrome c family protein